LTPKQFERFAGTLLSAYGFNEMKVTGKSGDGGIDGHGKLKVGLASMNVAFQCKRWQGAVGRPEIDKFRGAIQGEFEQGIFFTTSQFSSPAQEASIKKGAAPIVLLDRETQSFSLWWKRGWEFTAGPSKYTRIKSRPYLKKIMRTEGRFCHFASRVPNERSCSEPL
jgi:predicted helicase